MTPCASDEHAAFEAKVSRVLDDPTSKYDEGLKREAALREHEQRKQHAERLRRLSVVAVAAMKGDYGADAQAKVTAALQAFGDVRPEVEALARWAKDRSEGNMPTPIEQKLITRALDDRRVENSLRSCEALAREKKR